MSDWEGRTGAQRDGLREGWLGCQGSESGALGHLQPLGCGCQVPGFRYQVSGVRVSGIDGLMDARLY